MARLVTTSETEVVAGRVSASGSAGEARNALVSIHLDVLGVTLLKLLDHLVDDRDSSLSAGRVGGEATAVSAIHVSERTNLVWQPAPFHSPARGLGWNETLMPHSSQMRMRRKRAIQRWSPMSIPGQGPTWNSHWDGITSALMPEMVTPA